MLGSNAVCSASASGRSGSAWLRRSSHDGASCIGNHTPEMNASGNTIAACIGPALSAPGSQRTTAIPSAVNAVAPSATVSANAGSVRARIGTSNSPCASASVLTAIAAVTQIALPARPAKNAHHGSGVPLMRLSSPCSRAAARLTARFEKVVVTTP